MNGNAIDICALEKRYGERCAVSKLDLSIPEGELFGLLGVNGAGKTTTVKMLSCLLSPDGGDALIYGHSICRETSAVKSLIGISTQETAVAPGLTVFENLRLMAQIYGMNAKTAQQSAEDVMEQFGLTPERNSRAKILSGGWQRRLSIAMALISSPKVLFLDEPTLGLDVLARRELWKTITALKGKATIILTTHYLEEVEALCDRIGVMAGGRLIAVGTAEELKAQTGCMTLEDAFVSLAGGN